MIWVIIFVYYIIESTRLNNSRMDAASARKQQQQVLNLNFQISYEALTAEIQQLDRQNQLSQQQIPISLSIAGQDIFKFSKSHSGLMLQQNQSPLSKDGVNININYPDPSRHNLLNQNANFTQTNLSDFSSRPYSSNKYLPLKNQRHHIKQNGLNSIQQNQLEYRWSEEQMTDPHNHIVQSKIINRLAIQNSSHNAEQLHKQRSRHTVRRSTSAPQNVQNQMLFRRTNDSFEYQTDERDEFQHLGDRYSNIPVFSQEKQKGIHNGEDRVIISSIKTLSKQKGAPIYRSQPPHMGKWTDSKINFSEETNYHKQMSHKIDLMCHIVEELKHNYENRLKHEQDYVKEKQVSSTWRCKIETDLDQIKTKLQHLEFHPIRINSRIHHDTPSTHSLTKVVKQKQNGHYNNLFKDDNSFSHKISNIYLQKHSQTHSIYRKNFFSKKNYRISELQQIFKCQIWKNLLDIQQLQIIRKQALIYKILKLFDLKEKIQIIRSNYNVIAQLVQSKLIVILTSTCLYIGSYQVDSFNHYQKQGYGIFVKPQSQVYAGHFKNDLKSGRGSVYYKNKSSYSGFWLRDKFNGRGTFISQIGDHYEGCFQNNLKNGGGIQRFANGDKYQGRYQDNYFQGTGVYIWKNGSTYKGQFRGGKIEGTGWWVSTNGDSYDGEYRNNLKEGWGIYKWANGKVYQGYFYRGKRVKPKKQTEQKRRLKRQQNIIINVIDKTDSRQLKRNNARSFDKNDKIKLKQFPKAASQQKFRVFFNRRQQY